MSNINLFQNPTMTVPKSDAQIIRVDMDKSDIGGRKSHMPAPHTSSDMSISHVPNASSMPGGK